ncbi:helix-turn-helix domain-containing protein [Convivina intestini]|uniref:helix-turn-helix domain-containing protein n=1 Tax=Convivina intestini TaxID=1505726 RepID=UPI00338FF70C
MKQLTLKSLRINLNETQSDAASNCGVSRDTWSSWERGITFPNVPQIQKITSHYGINYDEINFLPNSTV